MEMSIEGMELDIHELDHVVGGLAWGKMLVEFTLASAGWAGTPVMGAIVVGNKLAHGDYDN